jgi:hypothetical protein
MPDCLARLLCFLFGCSFDRDSVEWSGGRCGRCDRPEPEAWVAARRLELTVVGKLRWWLADAMLRVSDAWSWVADEYVWRLQPDENVIVLRARSGRPLPESEWHGLGFSVCEYADCPCDELPGARRLRVERWLFMRLFRRRLAGRKLVLVTGWRSCIVDSREGQRERLTFELW